MFCKCENSPQFALSGRPTGAWCGLDVPQPFLVSRWTKSLSMTRFPLSDRLVDCFVWLFVVTNVELCTVHTALHCTLNGAESWRRGAARIHGESGNSARDVTGLRRCRIGHCLLCYTVHRSTASALSTTARLASSSPSPSCRDCVTATPAIHLPSFLSFLY